MISIKNHWKKIVYGAVLICALILAGTGGFYAGQQYPKNITVTGVTNINNPEKEDANFTTFWEAWQAVNDLYLKNSSIDNQQKVRGAMRGLVAALGDPYTQYFDPQDGEIFQQDVQGNFGGVGIEIGLRKNILAIIAPLKDSPADRIGLRSQDLIIAIDGNTTENQEVDQAVSKIRGEIGSTVTLTIMRDGWEKPKDFSITREKISLPTLSYELKDGKIGYVQIYSFNANVNELFYNAMVQAQKDGVEGIVLDLRNNPGGYLDVAVDIAGWFLKKKSLVVSEESRQGIGNQYRTQGNEALVNVPVVVLINKGSASASEILAGALRDQRKIPLIGEKSFGKGTIQQIKNLTDGSSIKITIAHWVMPSGKIIDHEGIEPDIIVPITDADREEKNDTQLNKALEVLRLEMKK
ncbi:MAG: hypothetical protein RIQ54_602 [Candidatus Parcubacteria bacterium]|jgi:carboxyl-terminal processing protease